MDALFGLLGDPTNPGFLGLVAILGFSLWRAQGLWNPRKWADRFGLTLTARNEGLVKSYILRTSILRTVGALVGVAAPWLYAMATDKEFHNVDLRAVFVGFLVGAVFAEITVKRPRPDAPSASLAPRKVSDYLSTRITSALRKVALLAYGLAGLYFLLPVGTYRFCPGRRELRSMGIQPDAVGCADMPVSTNDEFILFNLPVILLIVVVVELLQRYIVARPQPAVEADVREADNAIRSASVHALAGAGVGLVLVIIAGEVLNIFYKLDYRPLMLLGLIPFIGSMFAWARIAAPSERKVNPIEQPART